MTTEFPEISKILEPPPQKEKETEEDHNARFARGEISEEEIQDYWKNPNQPLFEHDLVTVTKDGQERRNNVKVRALTKDFLAPLLDEMKDVWDEVTFDEFERTLKLFLWQKRLNIPLLVGVEYYILTDENDHPFAMTGIYTSDIKTNGFLTCGKLDPKEHPIVAGGGWTAISKKREYRQTGAMSQFFGPWLENMAKNRGVSMLTVDTDDLDTEDRIIARNHYEKNGFTKGFNIPDYFGQGRDLFTYYADVSKEEIAPFRPQEKIGAKNRSEVLALAKEIFHPKQYEEFEVALNLFLEGQRGVKGLIVTKKLAKSLVGPASWVSRDEDGKIENFAIVVRGIYDNSVLVAWMGANPEMPGSRENLFNSLKGFAKAEDRNIIVVGNEGENEDFLRSGFKLADSEGIPEIFEKGNPAKQLFYYKKLT